MATKLVVNCATGVTQEIELTAAEIAQMETDAAAYAEAKASEEAALAVKATERAALLARLGLSEVEAQLLLGN